MLLAVDVGNTNVVFALFEGREIRTRWRCRRTSSAVPAASIAGAVALTPRLTGEYRDELYEISSGAFSMFYVIAFLIILPAALGLLNPIIAAAAMPAARAQVGTCG